MPPRIHRIMLLAVTAISALTVPVTPCFAQDSELDSFDAILEETDALLGLFEGTTVQDTPTELVSVSQIAFLGSIKSGVGHSSNFLKRNNPEESAFAQIEMDAYLGWASDTAVLSALLFAESTFYDYDLEPSEEYFTMVQFTGQFSRGAFDFGTELGTVYGSMIFDSSLTNVSIPAGTRIQQFVPTALLYMDWYASDSDRLRMGLGGLRAEYDLEGQDFYDYSIQFEWEHLWNPTLNTKTKLQIIRQVHDDDVARFPNGDAYLTLDPLILNRLYLEERLIWKPKTIEWLECDLSAGMKWGEEEIGEYEAMRQSWIGGGFRINNSWGRFRLTGRWGEYRYKFRTVDDSTLDLQTYRSLTFEYKRPLPWDLALILKTKWSSHNYRLEEGINYDNPEDDSYSERRGEILLEWSY